MSDELFKQQLEEATAKLPTEAHVEAQAEVQDPVPEDPYLEEALKSGYDPNHSGPNKKSPEQFVKDGRFFKKIDAQNKRIDELLYVVKKLDEHNSKLAQSEYQRGVQDAIARRKMAVSEGDTDAFDRAEHDLQQLQKNKPSEQPQNNNLVTQDMIDFAESEKSWFNNSTPINARMVKEADGLFALESQENPHLSQKEILLKVKDGIKKLHPEYFENPNKERPPTVGKSSLNTGVSKSSLVYKLTDAQRKFYNQAKNAGIKLSIEEYAKQLEQTGALRNE